MTSPIIKTPRGTIIIDKAYDPGQDFKLVCKAELKWNPGFSANWTRRFTAAQAYVDSEVLNLCEPFIPLRTGMLVLSGILGTEIGSGTVKWIAPYARRQYYSKRMPGSQTGELRGPYWFLRMKGIYGKRIIQNAKLIAGGKENKPITAMTAQQIEAGQKRAEAQWTKKEVKAGRMKTANTTASIPGKMSAWYKRRKK